MRGTGHDSGCRKLDFEALAYAALLVDPDYVKEIHDPECSSGAQMGGARRVLEKLGVVNATTDEGRELRREVWKIKQQREKQHERRAGIDAL